MALLLSLAVAGLALAASDVTLPRGVLGGGASESAGGLATLRGTLGQPMVGAVSGGEVSLRQGFWHGTGPAGPPAEIMVNSLHDPGDGVCDAEECTLREAVALAAPGDTIVFDPALAGGTITHLGEIAVAKNLTIDGSGLSPHVQLSGGGSSNLFGIKAVTVHLAHLDIRNGYSGGGAGAISANSSTLTISNCNFRDNRADRGGAIDNYFANLTVTDSTFSGNSAGLYGGAINNQGGTVTIRGSTFSGNGSDDHGGVLFSDEGLVTVINSTFYDNHAGTAGGGLHNYQGTMTVTNSTLSGNGAPTGGGIASSMGSTLHLVNNVVADSPSGGDCANFGDLATNTNNLIEDGSCEATLTGDPALEPLADNGGPTPTMRLPYGSPAVDAGDDASCEATDQRGVGRPLDGDADGTDTCDIGAYERAVPLVVTVEESTGGTLEYTDSQGNPTLIEVPAGAVTGTTTLAYTPVEAPAEPSGWRYGGHAFDLDLVRDGVPLPGLVFSVPVTITLHYSDADLGGVPEGSLLLEWWNEALGAWEDAACGPYDRHPDENWLAVPICHLSRFGLFGRNQVYLPIVVKSAGSGTG